LHHISFDPSDLVDQVVFTSSGNSFEFAPPTIRQTGCRSPVILSLFVAGLA
jgi:hypothetical protein